jgi:hypothetical protein
MIYANVYYTWRLKRALYAIRHTINILEGGEINGRKEKSIKRRRKRSS